MINIHKTCEWYDPKKDGCTNYWACNPFLAFNVSKKIAAICIKTVIGGAKNDESE